jgi:hypothetical protein
VAYAYPSGYNTWVPSWEATGQVIALIRNPNKFAINNYVAFRPANKQVGLYLEFDLDHPARSLTLDQMVWPEGTERPTGEHNLAGFEYKEYRTIRRDLAVTLGNMTIAQTDWPILAYHSGVIMQQGMTALTRQVLSVLDTSGNYGSNTDTATNLGSGAGKFELANTVAGDANFNNIRKVFNNVAIQILKQTNSMVRKENLWAIVSPDAARIMSQAHEITDYLKQSPYAMAQVRGDLPNRNVLFGLPEMLYGINLQVEDTVYVSSQKGATVARTFAKAQDGIIFVSKMDDLPGDQVGDVPVPNFSTFQVFYYNDQLKDAPVAARGNGRGLLSVETWEDVRNKRTEAHVTWNTAEKLVAPTTGYYVQDAFSSF